MFTSRAFPLQIFLAPRKNFKGVLTRRVLSTFATIYYLGTKQQIYEAMTITDSRRFLIVPTLIANNVRDAKTADELDKRFLTLQDSCINSF